MAFGQWLIEVLQTVGAPALTGAAVGAGITRKQKANEALHAIKAANYREVVRAYTELIIHLGHIESAARRTLLPSNTLLHLKKLDDHRIADDVIKEVRQEITSSFSEFRQYRDGLPEKIAPIVTHQSESMLFITISLASMSVDTLAHPLYMLTHELTDENFAEADKRCDEFRTELRDLNKRWSKWKEKEEMEASGVPSAPIRKRMTGLLRRVLAISRRRQAKPAPSRDATSSGRSPDGT